MPASQTLLKLAELLSLDVFPGAAVQAGLVKHEVGLGIGNPLGAAEKNRNAHRGANAGVSIARGDRGGDLAFLFDRATWS